MSTTGEDKLQILSKNAGSTTEHSPVLSAESRVECEVLDVADTPMTGLLEAYQQLQMANEGQTRLLADVSHEIRTPLNGIIGMARLLGDTRLTGEQHAYTQALLQSGETLLALVENLLDVSRIEAGQFTLRPVETDIVPFCEGIIELMALGAYAKHLSVGCHVAPCVPLRVSIDAERVRQVLYNLIGNAIKFTANGGVLLNVSFENGAICFCVRDSGSGLKPEHIDVIFCAFEQGNAGDAHRIQGAGLGLAISYQLAAAIGGTLSVESEYGCGSSFILRLPVAETAHIYEPSLTGKRYLIAGYAIQECEALALTLRGEGAEVHLIHEPETLCALMNSCTYEAVLMAVQMFEDFSARAPRDYVQDYAHDGLMIVLLDPQQKSNLAHMLQRGFDSFLMRPVRRSSLLRVLSSAKADMNQPKSVLPWGLAERNLRFLVADDNVINRHLTCNMLEKSGHEVISLCDGQSVLDLLLAPDPAGSDGRSDGRSDGVPEFDMLLLDSQMPELDGASVLKAIRNHEELHGGPALPVIILSADQRATTRAELLAAGANDFILKPAEPNTILTIIARHLWVAKSPPASSR
ncbi:response regulator [Paraburkholderia aspalathi]|nr:response regulator [Paraburkholderia aspalathi]